MVASRKQVLIAVLAILAIACHLLLRFAFRAEGAALGLRLVDLPLALALALCLGESSIIVMTPTT